MFVAIFYGIQIIWERDAGVLTKLLVTPTPRSALILGKSFSAGIRVDRPGRRRARALGDPRRRADARTRCTSSARSSIVMLGSAFFSCLSMTIAGIVLKRDRLMGIGQMITMPLFFASNALYPVSVMPGWLQALSRGQPAQLRGRRAARAADRHARPPRARLRRRAASRSSSASRRPRRWWGGWRGEPWRRGGAGSPRGRLSARGALFWRPPPPCCLLPSRPPTRADRRHSCPAGLGSTAPAQHGRHITPGCPSPTPRCSATRRRSCRRPGRASGPCSCR